MSIPHIVSQLKKDYLAGIGDSLDLVVVGGYYGKGKRTAVYGAFLLACYDAENEEWQTICKIGTGFSDEALQKHAETLKELEIGSVRGDIKVGGAKPDVWFQPKVVWEVLTADLSLSPVYTAAQGIVRVLFFLEYALVKRFVLRSIKGEFHYASLASFEFERTRTLTMLLDQSRYFRYYQFCTNC